MGSVHVMLTGGIGNQLFQIAAAHAVAQRHGLAIVAHVPIKRESQFSYGHVRRIQVDKLNVFRQMRVSGLLETLFWRAISRQTSDSSGWKAKVMNKLGVSTLLETRNRRFLPEVLDGQAKIQHAWMSGYWQSFRWIESYPDKLRALLTFKNAPSGDNEQMLGRIRQSTCPVSLHVRRGDMLKIVGDDGGAYLVSALRNLSFFGCNGPVSLFVFSDEIDWCRSNLLEISRRAGLRPDRFEFIFVDINGEATAVEDLRLMSQCKHHILSNSTFSWWGAWLNRSAEKKIIRPWSGEGEEMYSPEWNQKVITP